MTVRYRFGRSRTKDLPRKRPDPQLESSAARFGAEIAEKALPAPSSSHSQPTQGISEWIRLFRHLPRFTELIIRCFLSLAAASESNPKKNRLIVLFASSCLQ